LFSHIDIQYLYYHIMYNRKNTEYTGFVYYYYFYGKGLLLSNWLLMIVYVVIEHIVVVHVVVVYVVVMVVDVVVQ
jgi:hypothetical protein